MPTEIASFADVVLKQRSHSEGQHRLHQRVLWLSYCFVVNGGESAFKFAPSASTSIRLKSHRDWSVWGKASAFKLNLYKERNLRIGLMASGNSYLDKVKCRLTTRAAFRLCYRSSRDGSWLGPGAWGISPCARGKRLCKLLGVKRGLFMFFLR